MRTLTQTELQELTEIKELISAKGERAHQILHNAEAAGYAGIVFDHKEEIDAALKSAIEDNAKRQEYDQYLGEYKNTANADNYLDVNEYFEDEDGTYYSGSEKVYINGKCYSRDFFCELSQFQGAVDSEIWKRVN